LKLQNQQGSIAFHDRVFCSIDTDPSPAGKPSLVVVARVVAAVPMVMQGVYKVVDDPLSATVG
jgi:hypothetical protein